MTYYNPLFAYGIERFVHDAVAAGIDGLIVPDLPPEEAEELEAACRQAGLATIYLLAPTSTEERIRFVAKHCTGFIYLVSVTGITGARTELPPDLADFVARVRRHTRAAAGGRLWHRHRRAGGRRGPHRRRRDRRVRRWSRPPPAHRASPRCSHSPPNWLLVPLPPSKCSSSPPSRSPPFSPLP